MVKTSGNQLQRCEHCSYPIVNGSLIYTLLRELLLNQAPRIKTPEENKLFLSERGN
jgi:hypothetical protein